MEIKDSVFYKLTNSFKLEMFKYIKELYDYNKYNRPKGNGFICNDIHDYINNAFNLDGSNRSSYQLDKLVEDKIESIFPLRFIKYEDLSKEDIETVNTYCRFSVEYLFELLGIKELALSHSCNNTSIVLYANMRHRYEVCESFIKHFKELVDGENK